MHQISFYLDDEIHVKIQEKAKAEHRNFSDQLRYILHDYIEKERK